MAFITPAVLAWTSLAATVAGGAVSAYSQVQEGKAARKESEYQAQILQNQAKVEGYAAIQDAQEAERRAKQLREERMRNLTSQQAAAVKSGLTISGSVVDVLSDSAIASETDIQMVKHAGAMAVYNRMSNIQSLQAQRNLTLIAGKNRQKSANLGAFATGISTVGRAAGSFYSFKASGAFDKVAKAPKSEFKMPSGYGMKSFSFDPIPGYG